MPIEFDKIPEIEPSLEAACNEWGRFQIEVYLEAKERLAKEIKMGQVKVIYAPPLTFKVSKGYIRTRPDCLIVWGMGRSIKGIICINATIKYHLDNLLDKIQRMQKIEELTDCPLHVNSLFYKEPWESYSCPDCSQCWRPVFIPLVVTKDPYEGTSYSIVNKRYHLMDYNKYKNLLADFSKIMKEKFPNKYIMNNYNPKKCPLCKANLTLIPIWSCVYKRGYFIERCDYTLEEVNGKGFIHIIYHCCDKVCPRYVDCKREIKFCYFCISCNKGFIKDAEIQICKGCSDFDEYGPPI